MSLDWSRYAPYFTEDEFKCKHSGKCKMDAKFMDKLLEIRKAFGKPMSVSSGYRDKTHPIEARKATPGEHSTGMAVDIRINGADAYRLLEIAILHDIPRLGFNQKGAIQGRFIHLGTNDKDYPAPTLWTY